MASQFRLEQNFYLHAFYVILNTKLKLFRVFKSISAVFLQNNTSTVAHLFYVAPTKYLGPFPIARKSFSS